MSVFGAFESLNLQAFRRDKQQFHGGSPIIIVIWRLAKSRAHGKLNSFNWA
jgi:hypothetical protein